MPNSETRSFHIGDILAITTGRLVAPRRMDAVHDILSYMSGEKLFSHQLKRARLDAIPFLLEQYPQLRFVDVSPIAKLAGKGLARLVVESAIEEWLAEQVEHFGEFLPVKPMPGGENGPRDPMEELAEMVDRSRILKIELPGANHVNNLDPR